MALHVAIEYIEHRCSNFPSVKMFDPKYSDSHEYDIC